MIASVTGVLKFIQVSNVVIDVNGIGYRLNVSSFTISSIGKIGETVSLLTDLQIKDDKINMYGFCNEKELSMFRLLQTIQGIGPKASLSILSSIDLEQILLGINSSDKNVFLKADGIGSRVATRIVTELQGKINDFYIENNLDEKEKEKFDSDVIENRSLIDDCISAIINLGYTRSDAYKAVVKAKNELLEKDKNTSISIEKIVPLALKEFAGKDFE